MNPEYIRQYVLPRLSLGKEADCAYFGKALQLCKI